MSAADALWLYIIWGLLYENIVKVSWLATKRAFSLFVGVGDSLQIVNNLKLRLSASLVVVAAAAAVVFVVIVVVIIVVAAAATTRVVVVVVAELSS